MNYVTFNIILHWMLIYIIKLFQIYYSSVFQIEGRESMARGRARINKSIIFKTKNKFKLVSKKEMNQRKGYKYIYPRTQKLSAVAVLIN